MNISNLETELIGNEIFPMRRRTTLKEWIGNIAFGILYLAFIYGLILIAAK